jgi:hypothetical protein
MMRHFLYVWCALCLAPTARALTLSYEAPHWLIISGDELAGKVIRINYLEAYCRAGSTNQDWVKQTLIPHQTEQISLSENRKRLLLRDTVSDGLIVDHVVTADRDSITFQITAHNPTEKRSETHWAQPCIRLGDFTGYTNSDPNIDDYLPKCFLFLDGKLTRMNQIRPWAKEALYTPGQVWCPSGVPRTDVNPRPLSSLVPSHGLIGCFNADESMIFAVAFDSYQELFQGVARCLHSDFRLGGLEAGETKAIKGKIYIVPNQVETLLARYLEDFPPDQ